MFFGDDKELRSNVAYLSVMTVHMFNEQNKTSFFFKLELVSKRSEHYSALRIIYHHVYIEPAFQIYKSCECISFSLKARG